MVHKNKKKISLKKNKSKTNKSKSNKSKTNKSKTKTNKKYKYYFNKNNISKINKNSSLNNNIHKKIYGGSSDIYLDIDNCLKQQGVNQGLQDAAKNFFRTAAQAMK